MSRKRRTVTPWGIITTTGIYTERSREMKKTCTGCYAAETGGHPLNGDPHGCALDFKTDGEGHPQEECPKPKSWRQLKKEADRRNK